MKEKIKNYIDSAFKPVKKSEAAKELKDEIYANLLEKYSDNLSSGMSEEESYESAIASIGDVNELIGSISISHKKLFAPVFDMILISLFGSYVVILSIISVLIGLFPWFSQLNYKYSIGSDKFLLMVYFFAVFAIVCQVYKKKFSYILNRHKTEEETLLDSFAEKYGPARILFWVMVMLGYIAVNVYYTRLDFSLIVLLFGRVVEEVCIIFYALRSGKETYKDLALKYTLKAFWLVIVAASIFIRLSTGIQPYFMQIPVIILAVINITIGFRQLREGKK